MKNQKIDHHWKVVIFNSEGIPSYQANLEIRRKIAPYTGHVVSIRSQIDVNGGNRLRSQSTGRDRHPQIKALNQLNNPVSELKYLYNV